MNKDPFEDTNYMLNVIIVDVHAASTCDKTRVWKVLSNFIKLCYWCECVWQSCVYLVKFLVFTIYLLISLTEHAETVTVLMTLKRIKNGFKFFFVKVWFKQIFLSHVMGTCTNCRGLLLFIFWRGIFSLNLKFNYKFIFGWA